MKRYLSILVFLLSIINVNAYPYELWNYSANDDVRCVSIADLDNDGINDVIMGTDDKNITAINSDGSLLWNYTTSDDVWIVCCCDINNDNSIEVLAGNINGTVYALRNNGQLIWKYEAGVGEDINDITCADIDNDGDIEILFSSDNNNITVLSHNGNFVWSYETGDNVWDLEIIDYNGDGSKEIVLGSNDDYIYLLNSIGTQIWNFSIGNNQYDSISVGDLDGDGLEDIVSGSYTNNTTYAIKSDGTLLWKYIAQYRTSNYFSRGFTQIDDLDNDGVNEVIAVSHDFSGLGNVFVFASSGILIWNYSLNGNYYTVDTDDICGDEKKEIIVGTGGFPYSLFVFSLEGSLIWDIDYSGHVRHVVSDDIDNDGIDDIIAGNKDNHIYVYKCSQNDLYLQVTDVLFSNTNPQADDNIVITANIHKEKGNQINNVKVTFYADDVEINSTYVDFTNTNYVAASINWTIPLGTTEVKVKIDSNNLISESNENNNEVIRSITATNKTAELEENLENLNNTIDDLRGDLSDDNFIDDYGFYILAALIAMIGIGALRK